MVQVVIYKAKDGKVFHNKQECLKYEQENFPEIKVEYDITLTFFFTKSFLETTRRWIKKYIEMYPNDNIRAFTDDEYFEEIHIKWKDCKDIKICRINCSMSESSNYIILDPNLSMVYIDPNHDNHGNAIEYRVVCSIPPMRVVPVMDKNGICDFKDENIEYRIY